NFLYVIAGEIALVLAQVKSGRIICVGADRAQDFLPGAGGSTLVMAQAQGPGAKVIQEEGIGWIKAVFRQVVCDGIADAQSMGQLVENHCVVVSLTRQGQLAWVDRSRIQIKLADADDGIGISRIALEDSLQECLQGRDSEVGVIRALE